MGIYSIEGLGGVGKSTLACKLRESRIFVIDEISEVVPETKDVQQFTWNGDEAQRVNEWFLQKEVDRMKLALQQNPSILDRCVYSQIAYNFAKDRTYGTAQLPYLFHRLRQLEQEGHDLFPSMIYLSTSVENSIRAMLARAKNRERENIEGKNPAYRPDFFEAMKTSYDHLAELLDTDALVIPALSQADPHSIIQRWIKKEQKLPNITVEEIEVAHER